MNANNKCNIVTQITNKILDLLIIEINKNEMKDTIRMKIIHPLIEMIYNQLYPYIYTFIIIFFLMFVMMVVLLVTFLIYLRK